MPYDEEVGDGLGAEASGRPTLQSHMHYSTRVYGFCAGASKPIVAAGSGPISSMVYTTRFPDKEIEN